MLLNVAWASKETYSKNDSPSGVSCGNLAKLTQRNMYQQLGDDCFGTRSKAALTASWKQPDFQDLLKNARVQHADKAERIRPNKSETCYGNIYVAQKRCNS